MRLIAISDIHMGYTDSLSGLQMDDKEFHGWLTYKGYNCDRIYLVGDVLELLKGDEYPKSYKESKREVGKIEEKYRKSIALIRENSSIVYITGNHDRFERVRRSFPEKDVQDRRTEIENSEGRKIVFEHGDYDFMNGNVPNLADRIGYAMSRIEPKLKRFKRSIDRGIHKLFGGNGYQKKRFKKLIDADDSVEMYVGGHTHRAEIEPFMYKGKVRVYVNTGFFNGKQVGYTAIDTETFNVSREDISKEERYEAILKYIKPGDVLMLSKKVIANGVLTEKNKFGAIYTGKMGNEFHLFPITSTYDSSFRTAFGDFKLEKLTRVMDNAIIWRPSSPDITLENPSKYDTGSSFGNVEHFHRVFSSGSLDSYTISYSAFCDYQRDSKVGESRSAK